MKKLLAGLVTLVTLAVPGVASAHTGSVTCGSTGVVFSYQANFPVQTTVSETVNGVTKAFTVPANQAVQDTVPATSDHITAYATWSGGGTIPPTNLVCLDFTPPVCIPEVVTRTVYTPGPEVIQYVNVPGPTLYVTKYVPRIKYRTKIRWKVVYRFVVVKPRPPLYPRPAGVTG